MHVRPLWPVLCAASVACGGGSGSTDTLDPSTTTALDSSTTDTPASSSGVGEESSSDDGTPGTGSESSSDENAENGSICNNGVIEGSEECDCGGFTCSADGLDNKICSDIDDPLSPGPLTGGTLQCNPASCRFDTSMCSWCGDEVIGEHEECEPKTPIGVSCGDLGKGAAGTVVCGTECTYDTSGCTSCGARFEFQAGGCPHGFAATKLDPSAGGTSWQCGDPSNYAGGPGTDIEGVFATNIAGPYNPNEISALTSPAIDVSSCSEDGLQLELVHWIDVEGGEDNADGGIVQVSTDGSTWVTIAPSSGALYGETPITATYPPVAGAVGFSDPVEDPEWTSSVFVLDEYAGSDSLRVRLVFGSNANVQLGGWYVDTFEVRGVQR